jgi:hypothetical protein
MANTELTPEVAAKAAELLKVGDRRAAKMHLAVEGHMTFVDAEKWIDAQENSQNQNIELPASPVVSEPPKPQPPSVESTAQRKPFPVFDMEEWMNRKILKPWEPGGGLYKTFINRDHSK